jgi:hypothetical protein
MGRQAQGSDGRLAGVGGLQGLVDRGILCAFAILWISATLGWSQLDGSLKIVRSAHSSSLSNPTLQLTASSLSLGCRS